MLKDDVWAKAPKEATHYSEAGEDYLAAYWLVEDGKVVSMWLVNPDGAVMPRGSKLDQGHQRVDYSGAGGTPDLDPTCIKRPPSAEWAPFIGDRVVYQNTDSLDYAWDKPEEMEVISIHEGMYGLLGGCGYVWSQLHNISPPSMKKTEYEVFEEDMLDILLDGWQTSPSRAKALCEVLYETGLRFTNTEKSV